MTARGLCHCHSRAVERVFPLGRNPACAGHQGGKTVTRPERLLVYGACLWILLLGGQREAGAGPLAPDFWLPDLSGQMASLEEYRGKVVLLDFWATWCLPCRISIPELVEIQDKYRDRGVVILGISVDEPAQTSDADLRRFSAKFRMNYRVLRFNRQVVQSYFPNEMPPIPTMFVIDREGRIRDKLVGFRPGAVEKALKSVLD